MRDGVRNRLNTAWPHISKMTDVFECFHFEALDMFHRKRWTRLRFTGPICRCLMTGFPVQIQSPGQILQEQAFYG